MTALDRRTLLGATVALAAAAARAQAQPLVAQDDVTRPGATPHTRFAVNVEMWSFGGVPLAERIALSAQLGFKGVEIWPWRGKDLDALEKALKDNGVELTQFTGWGFSPGLNDPSNHGQFVEEIKASCKVAQRLGNKLLLIVAGNDQPGMTKAEMHAHVVTGLKLAAPLAADAGLTLVLEPMNGRVDHPGHCLYGSADAIAICEKVGAPNVKICWDLYHMQISEGDLCGHLKDGKDWIGYVQLADHPGRHEPGSGEIHYPRVLKQLAEIGYTGFVGLECSPSTGERAAAHRVLIADQW